MQRQLTVYAAVLAALCLLATGCSETVSVPSGSDNVIDDGNDTPDETPVEQPLQYGSINVRAFLGSEELQGVNIFLDGSDTEQMTAAELTNILVGRHTLSFADDGFIPYEDVAVNVLADWQIEATAAMVYDLSGTWVWEETHELQEWELFDPQDAPSYLGCENAAYVVGARPISFCLEQDNSLSLCKSRAEECGNAWGAGRVLDGGNRVEYDHYFYVDDLAWSAVYIRIAD